MEKLKGYNLIMMIERDGADEAIAYGTSCEFDIKADTKEISGRDSGRFVRLAKGKIRWQGSSAHIMADNGQAQYILTLAKSPKKVKLFIGTVKDHRGAIVYTDYAKDGKFAFQGYALITRATITGNLGSAATMSIEFKGSGPYTTDGEDLPDDNDDNEGGGGGDGGATTLGELTNVSSEVDSIPEQDRVLCQESGSGVWTWKNVKDVINLDDVFNQFKSTFLRKDVDDTAYGLITLTQGAIFGPEYIEGMKGGKIDGNGNGHLRSLTVDEYVEAPEFRFNRVSIKVGNEWRAPGGGIMADVVPDVDAEGNELMTGIATLHLNEGTIGQVAVDDICCGIYYNGMSMDTDTSEAEYLDAWGNFDDGRGNFKFAGFFTSYFRITEILNSDNTSFRYVLRPLSDHWQARKHPCSIMHFVVYGNFSDKTRQSGRYSTRTYERFLVDVNDWEFTGAMVARQDGDLRNLSIFGINMDGYSSYLNNIYMVGTISQYNKYPLRVELDTNGDNFLAYGESLHVSCKVMQGWDDRTSEVTKWKVTRDTGDAAADAAWANRDKVKNFSGEMDITMSEDEDENDMGENDLVLSVLFTFHAEIGTGEEKEESETTLAI
jgi:hypothetical protein